MKLLLDDKTTRGHNLNANEACIFAAILKCTRAGRGWYGNYRELAAAMPFVMSYKTANRAVQKLLTLGLIETREEKLFSVGQIVPTDGQNVPNDGQNVPENGQIVLPPNNPLNINNDMERDNIATCAQTCDTRTPKTPDFVDLIEIFMEKGGKPAEGATRAAIDAWSKCSIAKRTKLLAAVKSGAHFKPRLDWLISDFPEPQPRWLRGDEGGDIVQVKYNGAFKLCSRADMELFGLQWVRDW